MSELKYAKMLIHKMHSNIYKGRQTQTKMQPALCYQSTTMFLKRGEKNKIK